jgi:hypothetical protein
MKTNLVALVALMGGAVLVYCAMKNQDPRDVIRNALGASTTVRPIVPPAASGKDPDAPFGKTKDGLKIVPNSTTPQGPIVSV